MSITYSKIRACSHHLALSQGLRFLLLLEVAEDRQEAVEQVE
jgi:hypothetical protein